MSSRRRTIVFILIAFAGLCAVAVIDVTLLGGSGKYRRGTGTAVSVGNCVTIQEKRTACGDSDAWYRVTKERPTSDGCSSGRRRSEDRRFCLMALTPVKVDIQIPKLDIPTPARSR
ncbi:MAG: hypothetical protein ABI611_08630 [Solirubrobacteraceae bacterium]